MARGTLLFSCYTYICIHYSRGFHIHTRHISIWPQRYKKVKSCKSINKTSSSAKSPFFFLFCCFLGPHGWRLRQQDRRPGHGRTHALGRPLTGDARGGCDAPGPGTLGHLLRSGGDGFRVTWWVVIKGKSYIPWRIHVCIPYVVTFTINKKPKFVCIMYLALTYGSVMGMENSLKTRDFWGEYQLFFCSWLDDWWHDVIMDIYAARISETWWRFYDQTS